MSSDALDSLKDNFRRLEAYAMGPHRMEDIERTRGYFLSIAQAEESMRYTGEYLPVRFELEGRRLSASSIASDIDDIYTSVRDMGLDETRNNIERQRYLNDLSSTDFPKYFATALMEPISVEDTGSRLSSNVCSIDDTYRIYSRRSNALFGGVVLGLPFVMMLSVLAYKNM